MSGSILVTNKNSFVKLSSHITHLEVILPNHGEWIPIQTCKDRQLIVYGEQVTDIKMRKTKSIDNKYQYLEIFINNRHYYWLTYNETVETTCLLENMYIHNHDKRLLKEIIVSELSVNVNNGKLEIHHLYPSHYHDIAQKATLFSVSNFANITIYRHTESDIRLRLWNIGGNIYFVNEIFVEIYMNRNNITSMVFTACVAGGKNQIISVKIDPNKFSEFKLDLSTAKYGTVDANYITNVEPTNNPFIEILEEHSNEFVKTLECLIEKDEKAEIIKDSYNFFHNILKSKLDKEKVKSFTDMIKEAVVDALKIKCINALTAIEFDNYKKWFDLLDFFLKTD